MRLSICIRITSRLVQRRKQETVAQLDLLEDLKPTITLDVTTLDNPLLCHKSLRLHADICIEGSRDACLHGQMAKILLQGPLRLCPAALLCNQYRL